MLRSMTILGAPKWIEHCRTQSGNVAIIAGHQRQTIRQRGRGEEAIDDRDGPDGTHATPLVGHCVVDAKNPPGERGLHFSQPAFERRRLSRISASRKFDALSYLSKDKRAQKQIIVRN